MALPTRVSRSLQTTDPFDFAHRDFDQLLNRLFHGSPSHGNTDRLAPYAVDIREDQDHFYVEAELPGFKKDDVEITLENQTLTIAGQRQASTPPAEGAELLLHERRYSRFLRSFTLPPTVDEQTVNAKLVDGVLTITLNKREESKPRKITVS